MKSHDASRYAALAIVAYASLVCAGCSGQPDTSGRADAQAVAESRSVAPPPLPGGMRAYKDPETGRFIRQPPQAAAPSRPQFSAGLLRQAPARLTTLPDGTVRVELDPDFGEPVRRDQ